MADFCRQCSLHLFDEDCEDLAGLCTEDEMIAVICEGCGQCLVDSDGICISDNCLEAHGTKLKN